MTKGPLELVGQVAEMLDDLGIPYALGGSLASSLVGEPRSTVDVDIAVELTALAGASLLERAAAVFYVPLAAARAAIEAHTSFNLVDTAHGLKVDLFVLGDGLLDRRQIERRITVTLPGIDRPISVTSPEDQVLRKLDWYRSGAGASDRQWRDVLGILEVSRDRMDLDDLRSAAVAVDLDALLEQALAASR